MKKKHTVKEQVTKVKLSRKQYNGESSPYWNDALSHQRIESDGQVKEDPIANPDVLSDSNNIFKNVLSDRQDDQLEMVRTVYNSLSWKQRRIFDLCGYEGMAVADAARLLKSNYSTVYTVFERIKKRIQDACQDY